MKPETSPSFPHSPERVRARPVLLDTTLRDGEQSPGLYFTHAEKIELARLLDSLGVGIIEAGIPSMGKEEVAVLQDLMRLKPRAEILAWNRLLVGDVEESLRAGVSHVHVSVPTSDQLLAKKLGKDGAWVLRQMEAVIGFAVKRGLIVSLGAEDASRTAPEFLRTVFRQAQDLGAVRVRYADTLGILTPERTAQAMENLLPGLGIPLDFHAHNDFGLAGANALSAWKAGAAVVSCSLLGLGERAGNTALEEFVGCLHFLEGQFADFDLLGLRLACEAAARMSGRPMPSHKPLFGDDIFRHESGIHVDGLLKDRENYEFFPPELVGRRSSLVVGKHSGRAALKHLAAPSGAGLTDVQALEFLGEMRARMALEKGVNAPKMLQDFLKNLLAPGE